MKILKKRLSTSALKKPQKAVIKAEYLWSKMKDCPRDKTCHWLIKEYFKLGKILIEFSAESWQWPQN